jgi:hypothetical protein
MSRAGLAFHFVAQQAQLFGRKVELEGIHGRGNGLEAGGVPAAVEERPDSDGGLGGAGVALFEQPLQALEERKEFVEIHTHATPAGPRSNAR